jgi:hypothetical protein
MQFLVIMSKIHVFTLIGVLGLLSCGLNKEYTKSDSRSSSENNLNVIKPVADYSSLLRNPAMGWGLYDDANREVQQADEYWAAQDSAANAYASFFYIRWRWTDMEPEEGKYAWIYDENYKKLIKGALDRGLKLCFRVYDNGQDNLRPGTPDYVRKAGAKGYEVGGTRGKHWTPYPDDPIYREKFEKFVKAFAKEYDNPGMVDFVDGFNLGWWGEAHHIELQEGSALEEVFDWYTTVYSSYFKQVILPLPFGSQVGFETEKRIAIDKKGYAMRRDGLGSMWFSNEEQKIANNMYGKTLLIGESCWWQCSTDDCRPFASDTKYKLNTWRDVYELTSKQAIEGHFNTLDLRELPETRGWTTTGKDFVKKFISQGGYRLHPTSITYPKKVANRKLNIEHEWKNSATGYLPNNLPNWNYKYKPAFALINKNGEVIKYQIDNVAEPSQWLYGKAYLHHIEMNLADVPKGTYQLGVAIINKSLDNKPEIKLALADKNIVKGWNVIGKVEVLR